MTAISAIKQVARAMERVAPLRLAEKWDNVGLIMEAPYPSQTANKVLLTIDLTSTVVEEALSNSTAVIVAYHPPVFRPLTSLTLSNPLQSSLLKCVASGISVYSPHSALDTVGGGMNDWLAQAFTNCLPQTHPNSNDKMISPIQSLEGEEHSPGIGRIVTYPNNEGVPLSKIVSSVKKHLGLSYVQVASASELTDNMPIIKSIAICAGAGGSMLKDVKADLYFTGEMQHHDILAAVAKGTNVILCGHDNTERGYLPILKDKLQASLAQVENEGTTSNLEVIVSKMDRHPLRIVNFSEKQTSSSFQWTEVRPAYATLRNLRPSLSSSAMGDEMKLDRA